MMTDLLLDTCAVIWLAQGRALKPAAMAALEASWQSGRPVTVSAITAWELGTLSRKARLTSRVPPLVLFEDFVASDGFARADLPPAVLVASSFLPGDFHNDPADRIIVATARTLDLTVVTSDRLILDYAARGHVRALAC
jgi:PIN domain nuclease of toxin-antitoxin system